MAAKTSADDAAAAQTEAGLVEDNLAAVRRLAAALDETRWLYEDSPTSPEQRVASAGL
eukprot:CAMPEP_0185690624 /NCGR_PEP_ID=MMETSP1164-20130828/1244_1 /TAXON_ID=1104430 /ORGANISM="Chrysoreinhardia sp, Strain CCMP2950" /LENGTH=57 /DNA_ID=CAMNT_0028357209 /DNA_START=180 /DNA_END=353 /DNA_ORIENTATION=-